MARTMSRFLALILFSGLVFAAAITRDSYQELMGDDELKFLRLDDECCGCFFGMENVNDPKLSLMAEFAISQYNTRQSQPRNHLVFRNVVGAEYQVVKGTNYRLVIAAVNQSSPNLLQNYEALVHVGLFDDGKKLVSFTMG